MSVTEPVVFRGSLVRTRISRGGFWNTLTATPDQVALGRWPLDPVTVHRSETRAVRFQRVSLPLWWTTDVTFDTDGAGSRYIFSPVRPRRMEEQLRLLQWPIAREEDVKTKTLLKRLTRRLNRS